jgi:hypothetical protein
MRRAPRYIPGVNIDAPLLPGPMQHHHGIVDLALRVAMRQGSHSASEAAQRFHHSASDNCRKGHRLALEQGSPSEMNGLLAEQARVVPVPSPRRRLPRASQQSLREMPHERPLPGSRARTYGIPVPASHSSPVSTSGHTPKEALDNDCRCNYFNLYNDRIEAWIGGKGQPGSGRYESRSAAGCGRPPNSIARRRWSGRSRALQCGGNEARCAVLAFRFQGRSRS